MSIEVSGLTKLYGDQKAIDGLSFSIGRGEVVGFLGPNGAGKSTTMKIITGYLQPDGGRASVSGVDVSVNPFEAKKKIGYLPEANPLYYEMYVREYLDFVADVHQVKQKSDAIDRVIQTVGLAPESRKKIGQLSKGYKQRVGLAAALIHNPEVLILDEPTSGLDPNQIMEIRDVIRKLGENKTVLFSSHILQEIEALCDRVIIINNGKLVADDQLTNLQKSRSDRQGVVVQFKEHVDQSLFITLSDVISVRALNSGTWVFETANTQSVRKQILELSLQHNLNIVSLRSDSQSLEDIFRDLTTK